MYVKSQIKPDLSKGGGELHDLTDELYLKVLDKIKKRENPSEGDENPITSAVTEFCRKAGFDVPKNNFVTEKVKVPLP